MKEEEMKIWKEHQRRLASISREREAMNVQYYNGLEELTDKYGGILKVPADEKKILDDAFKEQKKIIEKKEFAEIKTYMDEIEKYDAQRVNDKQPGRGKEDIEPDRD